MNTLCDVRYHEVCGVYRYVTTMTPTQFYFLLQIQRFNGNRKRNKRHRAGFLSGNQKEAKREELLHFISRGRFF